MGFWKDWEIGMTEDGFSRREITDAAKAMNPRPRLASFDADLTDDERTALNQLRGASDERSR